MSLLHTAHHVAMGPLPSVLWASLTSIPSYNALDLKFLFIKRPEDHFFFSCLFISEAQQIAILGIVAV